MRDQICIVTGATEGIGRQTALGLAGRGASVTIIGRNAAKVQDTVLALQERSGNAAIDGETADLSSLDAVRALGRRLGERLDRVDVLVNNAGGYFAERRQTVDGLEHTFALNHLAYALLTDLLLPQLRAAPAARIVNVASSVHRGVTLDFEDLQLTRRYDGWLAYRRSKLMNVMYTYALSRRLGDGPVTVNVLHPGFVRSHFGHNNAGLRAFGMKIAQRLGAISVEAGAATSLHVATDPALAGVSGRYFEKSRMVESSPQSRDETAQERLWAATHALL